MAGTVDPATPNTSPDYTFIFTANSQIDYLIYEIVNQDFPDITTVNPSS